MRRIALALAILLSAATLQPAHAATLAGVTLPDTAEVGGDGVSFLLGPVTFLFFGPETTISLAASRKGELAGLLFFGSRTQSKLITHTILSKNARTMLGTIYFPSNSFIVDGSAQIGQEAAYTAIVARRVVLMSGPNLVLNTNYDLTDVPVPDGIRGAGQPVSLVK